MKAVAKIKLHGLMASKAVRKIFDIVQGAEKSPQILFVGGCVRNAILGAGVSDIDLATKLSPQDVTQKLKASGVKVVPTGIEHGTVTAVLEGESFQITTLRHDIDTDGRHAKVAYTEDWAADARRRDFTMNTLLCDIKGNIFDPLGVGLRDLEKRKVIFVGDPAERIAEDYLRVLRFFRFHAWYGKGAADVKALVACAAASRNLKTLSKERVTQEVLKILLSPRPGETLELMRGHNVLKSLIGTRFKADYFKPLKIIENTNFETMGLLIISDFAKSGTDRIENQLRLSNKQKDQLDRSVSYLKKFKQISPHDIRLLLYRMGHEVGELVLISRLLLDGETSARLKKEILRFRDMERPVMPLRGQDLIDQGMQPGPAIKKALEKFERSWIGKDFKA